MDEKQYQLEARKVLQQMSTDKLELLFVQCRKELNIRFVQSELKNRCNIQ